MLCRWWRKRSIRSRKRRVWSDTGLDASWKGRHQKYSRIAWKRVTLPVLIWLPRKVSMIKGHGLNSIADDFTWLNPPLEELKYWMTLLKRSGKFNENTAYYSDVTVNLSTNSTLVDGKKSQLLGKRVWFVDPSESECYFTCRHRFSIVCGALTTIQRFLWWKSI